MPLTVSATTGQTASMMEWFNAAGTKTARVAPGGGFAIGINGLDDTSAWLRVLPDAAAKGIVVRGAVSQTANLQEWQTGAGTIVAKIDSRGLGLFAPDGSGASTNAGLEVHPLATNLEGFVVKAMPSQTADLAQFRASTGTVMASVNSDGRILASQSLAVLGNASRGAALHVYPTASQRGLLINGAASQTGNLTEWQNSAGATLSWVGSGGGFIIGGEGPAGAFSSPTAYLNVQTRDGTSNPAAIFKAAATQSKNLVEFHSNAGGVYSAIGPFGHLTYPAGFDGTAAVGAYVGYITVSVAGTNRKLAIYA